MRKYSLFLILWMVLIPFIFSTLQWRRIEDLVSVEEPPTIPRLDPIATSPLIPEPPSSTEPLQVVYIGGYRKIERKLEKGGDYFALVGHMLASLQLSKYIRVVRSVLYDSVQMNTPVRFQELDETHHDAALFVVDWVALQRDCHVLDRILQLSSYNTQNHQLVLMDTSGSPSVRSCPTDAFMVKKSLVQNRHWGVEWVVPGQLQAEKVWRLQDGVVEDFVDALRKVSGQTNRTIPIVHYWSSATMDNDIPNLQYSFLRRSVSHQIKATHKRLAKSLQLEPWLDQVGIISETRESYEERDVVKETALTLSAAKIVVVAQNDEWEYVDDRLIEAMASGAMVMSDSMIAPLPELQNKTNIIFYDSLESLDRLISYYLKNEGKRLAIAHRGQDFALGRHRAWHAYEQLFFGKPLSRTDKGLAKNPGKPILLKDSRVKFVPQ